MLSERARFEALVRNVKTVFWGDLEVDEVERVEDFQNIAVGTIATFTTDGEEIPFSTETQIQVKQKGRASYIPAGTWRFVGSKKIDGGDNIHKVERIQ